MDIVPFRILSLNGGGVKGIFQACFLKKLSEVTESQIFKHFDLIAGTSTGSIIALALALDIDIDRIKELYKNKSKEIFKNNFFSVFKKGPRYDQNVLKQELEKVFENKQLRDVRTNVLITATCLDQFGHRVFTSFPIQGYDDSNLSITDIALASSAAPTFFGPIKPKSQERSYVDGGLWANSPSLISILYSKCHLNIPIDNMKLISIGTGDFPKGFTNKEYHNLRIYSGKTIKTIFELMFLSQQSATDDQTKLFLGDNNFSRISPQLDEFISLDDYDKAIKKLPPLAESLANDKIPEILDMLQSKVKVSSKNDEKMVCEPSDLEFVSKELIEASGLTGFYPARRFYSSRKDASSIDTYVGRSQKNLVMISINLLTGLEFDNLCIQIQNKLNRINEFNVIISLLNPNKADLIFSISPILNKTKDQLYQSIKSTIDKLVEFRIGLSSEAQKRFDIRVHNTIPFGSAIMIDHRKEYGRIQIETKPYKAVLNDSFAFEVAPYGKSSFYQSLVRGYEKLLDDGHSIEEIDLT